MYDHEYQPAMLARLDALVGLMAQIRDRLPEPDQGQGRDVQRSEPVELVEPAPAGDVDGGGAGEVALTEPAPPRAAKKTAPAKRPRRGTS